MDDEQSVVLVQRYAEVVTGGDVEALGAICAADFVNHRPTGTEAGLDALRAFVGAVRRTLPDIVMTVDVAFVDTAYADGPRVGALVTQRGTSAQLGRAVAFRELHVFRVAGGLLAEHWLVVDRANFPLVVTPGR